MSAAVDKIVQEMTDVVPPGQSVLDYESREKLVRLTALLVDADDDAPREYDRYRSIAERTLHLGPLADEMRATYGGRRILVTGGTGCIGSKLVRLLAECGPSDIFCIYTGSNDFDPVPGVVYIDVDIRDEVAVRTTMRRIAPQVVFHCAAQRSPWLAEREVVRTLETNVSGTRNVLAGARDADVPLFVHASTGKAMRYYTTDVYAASKKLAEWLVADYVEQGHVAGVARFTHVVDNAVVLERVESELDDPHGVIRVHDADISFYAQSAVESAQLLMLAGLRPRSPLQALAIRSLGEPAQLLELVLGRIGTHRHRRDAALYLSGYDKGYERGSAPGLYDPLNAGDLSPLVNAVEARTAGPVDDAPDVDRFQIRLAGRQGQVDAVVDRIERLCRAGVELDAAAGLARAGQELAEAMFRTCPDDLLHRLHRMADRGGVALPTTRRPRRLAS